MRIAKWEYDLKAKERRKIRTEKHQANVKLKGKECPDCGGIMHWCTICREWTKICCYDYGTCECS